LRRRVSCKRGTNQIKSKIQFQQEEPIERTNFKNEGDFGTLNPLEDLLSVIASVFVGVTGSGFAVMLDDLIDNLSSAGVEGAAGVDGGALGCGACCAADKAAVTWSSFVRSDSTRSTCSSNLLFRSE
jgi:hypothetical protein